MVLKVVGFEARVAAEGSVSADATAGSDLLVDEPEYALLNFCRFCAFIAGRAAEAAMEAIFGADVRRAEAIVLLVVGVERMELRWGGRT